MQTPRAGLPAVVAGAASLLLSLISGCGDPDQLVPSDAALSAARALVAARPYDSKVPQAYDATRNWPLIVLLHGYGASGLAQDLYFGLSHEADNLGFLEAYPDGTLDSTGKLFWNATDVCCDFDHKGIDDVTYVDAVIDDMSSQYRIDRRRVYVIGHSNGGFMAHRYACERTERLAAIISLAGDNWKDTASHCHPQGPLAVLQVHGDMDMSVPYQGGTDPDTELSLPSALETLSYWAGANGCSPMADQSAPDLDLDQDLAGNETKVTRFTGCQPGGAAELWTIRGGSHVPDFYHPGWADEVWGWFSSHPKP